MGWLDQRSGSGQIVNKRELAELLDVSEVTLTEWQKEGMPVVELGGPGVPGRYDTADVIRWACLREIGKTRTATSFDRLNDIRARREEIGLQRELGEVVLVRDIRPAFEHYVAQIDGTLASVREKYVLALEAAPGPDGKDQVLGELLDEVREAMANYEHCAAPAAGGGVAAAQAAGDQSARVG